MSNTPELPARMLATVVARRLQVAPRTANRLVEAGELDDFRIGCRRYVTVASFDRYLKRIAASVGTAMSSGPV